MLLVNGSPDGSDEERKMFKYDTDEENAVLRERLAHLNTPDEIAAQLDELLKNVGDIVIIGQRMLNSNNRTVSSDDARR